MNIAERGQRKPGAAWRPDRLSGVAEKWPSPRSKSRGGQAAFSDLAIEIRLSLRIVFRLALRQTQGIVRSLIGLLDLDLAAPDFSTLSRRSKGLKVSERRRKRDGAITLIVPSRRYQHRLPVDGQHRSQNAWRRRLGCREARDKKSRKTSLSPTLRVDCRAAGENYISHSIRMAG